MDADTLPPHFSASEAAKFLGRSKANMSQLIEAGKLPGSYQQGRLWFIPREAVLALKMEDEENGVQRTGKRGRPVTTGAGQQRKDRGGPGGRPPKKV